MNQKGRDYLAEHVRKVYKEKDEELKAQLPKEPELNNYLIEAFLSGTMEFRPYAEIQERLKDYVLQRGPEKALLAETHGRWDEGKTITERRLTVPPDVLFLFPAEYHKVHAAWQQEYARIQALRNELTAYRETILLKINIGSDKVLDELVAQADNLVDLALVKDKLVIAGDSPSKQLTDASSGS